MKTEILRLLRESEGYVSGQRLCEELGVSRTAVWKVIRQLKEEGYHVEAVQNRGYRIVDIPDVMSEEELKSLIAGKTQWAGQEIHYFSETDSTNIRAKELGEKGAPHGTLAVAGQQSAGRGRRGRGWESPPGCSIYMSILLRPRFFPSKAPMLTLVMAYSVAKALQECTGQEIRIKWPNDIVLNGKKLVGILTEMSSEIDYINHVVIGVGINVNMDSFSEEIAKTATSFRIETGQIMKRSTLIVEIMKHFERNYEAFLRAGDLSGIRTAYNGLLVNCGREVRILGAKEPYQALALGINDSGELLVRKQDGSEEAVYAGEVSVRGIYGYV
ncbi:biotin--[acetyl-CoA-carboxylase] ligase [Lachnospiraceae bacterium]|nr:biotin--[acetyl-CoA-carboxylase] ligase [uncultured Schaedlerella sp.]EOS38288.1 biotin-[acetyl-CoA-carboxylase] ligase [Lachnospiraceae bacterium M18-1]MCI9152698.1 biotin--[acetyl-CoA-carboxylase] ligase [Ruminococcus sp.]NBI59413.1 biotin--[acetyl-CoA-carboxylase] ligase [Lachnospiraceae bacterium]